MYNNRNIYLKKEENNESQALSQSRQFIEPDGSTYRFYHHVSYLWYNDMYTHAHIHKHVNRHKCMYSAQSRFDTVSNPITSFFSDREYPCTVINAAKERSEDIDREQALQTSVENQSSASIPLVRLSYHPSIHSVLQTILRNFYTLLADPTTRNIFTDHTPPSHYCP